MRFLDTIINNHFVALAPFLFMDLEPMINTTLLIQEVSDAQGGVNANDE
jgi:hypothetical protein